MKKRNGFFILSLVCMAFLTACNAAQLITPDASSPTTNSPATMPPVASTPAAPKKTPQSPTPAAPSQGIAAAALVWVAKAMNLNEADVEIISVEAVQWSDSCLGVSKAGEMCLQVITPGYRILAKVKGETVELHSNESGSAVRQAGAGSPNPGGNKPPIDTQPQGDVSQAAAAAITMLAKQLSINPTTIQVIKDEMVEWPNGCLGVQMMGKLCAMHVVPGHRVILAVGKSQYEFHTNADGSTVLLAADLATLSADKVLVWEQSDGAVCSRVEIGTGGVAFGPCGGNLLDMKFANEKRTAQMTDWIAKYGSFFGATKAGTMKFNGQGKALPDEAEQRSMAEWAKEVFNESQSVIDSAAQGVVLTWHREGGIAGFCDDLTISVDGWAEASSCKGTPKSLGSYRLTPLQLKQMYVWLDAWKSFDVTQNDPDNVADAMKTHLIFTGRGAGMPSESEKANVMPFAQEVFSAAPTLR